MKVSFQIEIVHASILTLWRRCDFYLNVVLMVYFSAGLALMDVLWNLTSDCYNRTAYTSEVQHMRSNNVATAENFGKTQITKLREVTSILSIEKNIIF
jgi:hypothetical protein